MKKELVACLFIIVFIIIANFVVQSYVDKTLDSVMASLQTIKENLNDNNEKIIEETYNNFNKRSKILTCFVDHKDVSEIEEGIILIKATIIQKDFKKSYEEIEKISYIINGAKDKRKVKLDTIF